VDSELALNQFVAAEVVDWHRTRQTELVVGENLAVILHGKQSKMFSDPLGLIIHKLMLFILLEITLIMVKKISSI
jgi:hypothetical protein